jgi:hypothetical protein
MNRGLMQMLAATFGRRPAAVVPMPVLRNLDPDDPRTLAHYDREMTAFLEGRRPDRPVRRSRRWSS